MKHWARRIILAGMAGAAAASGALAGDVEHRTQYRVALGILPIARADFLTEIRDDKSYKVSGDISSAGLADLVTTITARTSVSGVMGGQRLQASRYTLYYKSGKKARTYDVRLRNGNIVSTVIKPDRPLPNNWVGLKPSDMRAVLDPVSGLILPASSDPCAQKLPIFDGEMRMDLLLAPKGSHAFSAEGFKGEARVCKVRFVPRSGYRKGRSDIDYLSKSGDMEIWFAKAGNANVYGPVYVRIPTRYGPVTITATRYGAG